jgi:hypothetical protein
MRDRQVLSAGRPPAAGHPQSGSSITLTVYSPGTTVSLGPKPAAVQAASMVQAGTVAGHPVFWVTRYDTRTTPAPGHTYPPAKPVVPVLAWAWGPDAWAELEVNGYGSATNTAARAIALHVARTVRLDLREAVRLPFTLSGLPAGLRLDSTSVSVGPDWGARLSFSPVRHTGGQPSELRVWVGPLDGRRRPPGAGSLTVDGAPAQLDVDGGRARQLTIWGLRGTFIVVNTIGPDTLALFARDGQLGAYRHLHLVRDPANQADWVDRPLR